MSKTEAADLKQQQAVAAIQGNLHTLSHAALHLKVDPTNERVHAALTTIDQTKRLLPLIVKNRDPFTSMVEAHIGAHILHTADVARKKGFFTAPQAEIHKEDGHQYLSPALVHLQQFDAANTKPQSYSLKTLQTIRAILPFVGPLTDQRAFFEDVFMVEQQRLETTALRAQQLGQALPRQEADNLIREITQGLGMYKREYLQLPIFGLEPAPRTAPQPTGRLRRQQLQPLPPYYFPSAPQRQYAGSYPAYPQPRYQEPSQRQYYPQQPLQYAQPGRDYLDSWPWMPQRDATQDESMGLPRFGPTGRNDQRR